MLTWTPKPCRIGPPLLSIKLHLSISIRLHQLEKSGNGFLNPRPVGTAAVWTHCNGSASPQYTIISTWQAALLIILLVVTLLYHIMKPCFLLLLVLQLDDALRLSHPRLCWTTSHGPSLMEMDWEHSLPIAKGSLKSAVGRGFRKLI